MKIFVGILSARINVVGPIARLLEWAQEPSTHEVKVAIDETFGLDAGRSALIDRAKAWGPDLCLFFDSDVIPELPLEDFVEFINQDLRLGYAAVVSVTLSASHQLMVFKPDNSAFQSPYEIPTDRVFEVGRAALGFFAISGEALPKLAVLDTQPFINGPSQPLYCVYRPDRDDSYSLCDNIRESCGRLACDPRLKVQHMKLQGIPSWRDGMLPPGPA